MPGPGPMMSGQPLPGRMVPTVAANIHPTGSIPTPPGMPPLPGNILGPRGPLTAPNGMCKYTVELHSPRPLGGLPVGEGGLALSTLGSHGQCGLYWGPEVGFVSRTLQYSWQAATHRLWCHGIRLQACQKDSGFPLPAEPVRSESW